ncbi:PAS domain S-box protein [Escherichia coli]|nr:PAS domain S-box protein [Escherichia coli]
MMAADPSLLATPRTYLMSHMPWLPLLLILLPANIMTMVMYAFRAERKHISESETRFRNAMEYSAIGMALVGTEGQWLQTNKALCQFLGYSQKSCADSPFSNWTAGVISHKDLQQVEKLISGEINTYSMENASSQPQWRCCSGVACRLTGAPHGWHAALFYRSD